jgi:hypothetical protein
MVVCTVMVLAAIAAPNARAISVHPLWHSNGHLLGESVKDIIPVIARGEIVLKSSAGIKMTCQVDEEGTVYNLDGRGRGEISEFNGWNCSAPAITGACSGSEAKGQTNYCDQRSILTSEMPLEVKLREAEVCAKAGTKLKNCPLASEREVQNIISSYHRAVTSLPWKTELASGERNEEQIFVQRTGLHEYGEGGSAAEASTACYPEEGGVAAAYQKVPAGCMAVNVVLPDIPLEMVFYGTQELTLINGVVGGLDASRLESVEAGELFSSQGLQGTGSIRGRLKLSGEEALQLIFAQ